MNRQEYLLEMRKNHTLKGRKPCFIFLRFNTGKIYNDGYSELIMSFKDGILYFQKLSRFFKKLQPSMDFELSAKRFKEYRYIDKSFMKILYLFDKDGRFIEICFQIGKAEYSSTITNIERIIEEMCSNYGLKPFKEEIIEDEEGTDSKGEGSNQEVRN